MTDTSLITPDGEYVVDVSLSGWDPALYPEGTVEVPTRPASNYRWEGGAWVEFEQLVTSERVNLERDRRLAEDMPFMGHTFDFDPVSKSRITGASILAMAAIQAGADEGDYRWDGGTEDFAWITADNLSIPMDAQTVFALGQAAASREARLIHAAKTLKSMSPIPQDYTDDMYW